MSKIRDLLRWGIVLLVGCLATQASGQLIGIGSPFTTATNSYYEHFGVNFGLHFPSGGQGAFGGSRIVGLLPNGQFAPGISFTQNSAGGTIPPFGGFDPGSAANFGFGRFGSGGGFSLGLTMGKGSTRMLTSTTPSLTMFNGTGGSMFHGEVRPFVMGVIPINGGGGNVITRPVNGVTIATSSGQLDLRNLGQRDVSRATSVELPPLPRSSSAERAVDSVAEIKARRDAESRATLEKIKEHLQSAADAVSSQQYAQARSHLKMAHDLTEDKEQRRELKAQIESLRGREKILREAKRDSARSDK